MNQALLRMLTDGTVRYYIVNRMTKKMVEYFYAAYEFLEDEHFNTPWMLKDLREEKQFEFFLNICKLSPKEIYNMAEGGVSLKDLFYEVRERALTAMATSMY